MVEINDIKKIKKFNVAKKPLKILGCFLPENTIYGLYEDYIWLLHPANNFRFHEKTLRITVIQKTASSTIYLNNKIINQTDNLYNEILKHYADFYWEENDIPECQIAARNTFILCKYIPKGTVFGKINNTVYYYIQNNKGINKYVESKNHNVGVYLCNKYGEHYCFNSFRTYLPNNDKISIAIKNVLSLKKKIEISYPPNYTPEPPSTVRSLFDLVMFTAAGNIKWHKSPSSDTIFICHFRSKTYYFDTQLHQKSTFKYKNDEMPLPECAFDKMTLKGIIENYLEEPWSEEIQNGYVRHTRPRKVITNNHFLVRTNIFKCYHDEHTIIDVIGILHVIRENGSDAQISINCAYCEECGHFFILDSIYKELKKKYQLLCKIISEKNYTKYNGNPYEYLRNCNSESILKMNGYNVQATNGLTSTQRKKILMNMVDNNIISEYNIASFLDSFIAQKQALSNYQLAVSKWREDRDFILQYKNLKKQQIQIESIKEKKRILDTKTLSYITKYD